MVTAAVKGYGSPFRVLIDSGASKNYAREQSVAANSTLFHEAMKKTSGTISVRLATGLVVTRDKIDIDLAIKFGDFDFTEHFTVLEMDERYDLILGMPWLEAQEPWIDWKTKSIGSSLLGVNHTFGSHDPTVVNHRASKARSEHRDHFVGVCDTVYAQEDENPAAPVVAPTTPALGCSNPWGSGARCSLPSRSSEGRRREMKPRDWARRSSPVRGRGEETRCRAVGGRCSSRPRSDSRVHFRETQCRVVGGRCSSRPRSDSCVQLEAKNTPVPTSTVEPSVGVAPPTASRVVNALTGDPISPSKVDMAPLPDVPSLLSLEEQDFQEFMGELQAGDIAEVVILRSKGEDPERDEFNASSVMDPSVVDDFRRRFESRRGSEILKDPTDPYFRLLTKYVKSCLNPKPPSGLPPDRGVRHEIDLVPGTGYLLLRQWPLPREQADEIDAFFEKKRAQGLVRESKSPHSAPTFCVRKPNGKWRIVHAFNKLNAQTVPAQTPIPRKDVIINHMSGSKRFSVLDLVDGYYQVLMRDSDVPLTAVSTPSGMLWEWLVMPQGLSNAPATFNRLVTHLFRPLRAFAQTYFDDIFVHTKPEPGRDLDGLHLEHLEQVLACMAEHSLYANLDKCIFGAEEVPVLGCFVGVDGVRADPAKVQAIAEWPVPRSQKELRKWLGLANYLHRYSANYAELARPLSDLLKKDTEWSWTAACADSFAGIKQSLLEAPILALPDDDRPYSVVCDASDFAIGCALVQQDAEGHERVISYQSRQLKAAERNYPVHDKELLAMKYALVKFRVHLLGSKPFVVYTDHASLRTATQSPHLSQRMARWLSFFAEYNFTVAYKPGKLNVLADALSRRPDYELSAMTFAVSDVYDLIRESYVDDDQCWPVLQWLSKGDDAVKTRLSSRVRARLHRYETRDGLLYYQVHPGDSPRVVVPNVEDLKYKLVYEVHDTPMAGHLGREKTYAGLSSSFWWPKMYKWVAQYVRTCDVCQRVKPSPHSQAPLASLPVPTDCWRSVSLDFFFGLPRDANGNNGVLVFVDRLSKMVHLAPVVDEVDGPASAKLFVDMVFRHHGLPDSIVSDRDTRFTSEFWKTLFRLLGTRLDMATKDHPETDGQTERANRVVEDVLRSFCAASPTTWSDMLPMVEFAVNNSVHASTGFTPFFLNGLRHPALPLCLMGDQEAGVGGARQAVASHLKSIDSIKRETRDGLEEFLTTRINTVRRVRDAMAEAQDLQKEQADKNGRKNVSVFTEGQYVLVSTKNIANAAVSSLGSSKLLPRFLGPFKVLKRAGTAYTLDLPSWIKIHPTFYVGLLKEYLRPVEGDPTDVGAASGSANANVPEPDEVPASAHAGAHWSPPPGSPEDAGYRVQGRERDHQVRPPRDGRPSTRGVQARPRDTTAGQVRCGGAEETHPSGSAGSPVLESDPCHSDAVAPSREHDPRAREYGRRADRPQRKIQRPLRAPLPVVDRNGVAHFHVERIVDSRRRAGRLELLVKWLGYPSDENSWEPHEQLLADCKDVVREWERENPHLLH